MKQLATVTLVVLGLTLLAPVQPRAAEAESPTVDIIHNGQTITVGMAAAAMHILLHGDMFACLPPCIPG